MKKINVKSEEVKKDSNLSPILDKLDRKNNYNVRHKKEDREKKKRAAIKKKYPSS